MIDLDNIVEPPSYSEILLATAEAKFDMPSDKLTCALLRTLAASKKKAAFLELGTGTGLSTSWILDGMDSDSKLVSVDNDDSLLAIAEKYLGNDDRLDLIHSDGGTWIQDNLEGKFDFVFADTWHGKYLMLEETLKMLKDGGFYVIDDMLPQENWPDGHHEKAVALINDLESRSNLVLTKMNWASGTVLVVKKESPSLR